MVALGQPFVVQIDHGMLQWLSNVKDESSHLTNWCLAPQPYQFNILQTDASNYGVGAVLSQADTEGLDLVFFKDKNSQFNKVESNPSTVPRQNTNTDSLCQILYPNKELCKGKEGKIVTE